MADLQLRQGNKSAAMKIYDEQVRKFGTPASYSYRGQLWKELSNLANAIADFEEAIKLYPEDYAVYVTLGETYLANGDLTKAIDVLNAVMEREPGYRYIALLLRARTHRASGNLEEAIKDFDETVRVNTDAMVKYPGFVQGYVTRGHAHAEQGHIEEAVADYKKALEANPTHPESDTMHEYISDNS
jgi:tetratricopeptide (TPR) repeat protein